MTAIDTVNRVYRENKRYTGDGLPGEPINAPLPVGDPQSGPHSPKKSEIRTAHTEALVEAAGSVAATQAAAATAVAEINSASASASEEIGDLAQETQLAFVAAKEDVENSVFEASQLVEQATAGFAGFVDGLGYDFGSVADPITYFDQDWGSL